jgi:SAM-dependent methyltransferase
LARAYSAGAEAWAAGPVLIYGRLAELLVASSPVPLAGRRVLDLGAGTGAASRPATAAGAEVVAVDAALGMLRTERDTRPPGAIGDAIALPFRDDAFDLVVAAFSLNHLHDPVMGLRETARVIETGGFLLASTYATDDDHPVKEAVSRALAEFGWVQPSWYPRVKMAMAAWGTVASAAEAVARGGLRPVRVERREVAFPALDPDHLVAWRLGMAQSAPFFATLDASAQLAVARRARELLGSQPPPLIRAAIFAVAEVG